MIRFSCGSCGRSLHAPDAMAGKKGRCAQCGGVNLVPAATALIRIDSAGKIATGAGGVTALAVNSGVAAGDRPVVEVTRVVATSPFRSTADLEKGRVIVGQVTVESPTTFNREGSAGDDAPRDFFEQVAPRLAEIDPELPEREPMRLGMTRPARAVYEEPIYERPINPATVGRAARPADWDEQSRVLALVLGGGIVLGFCLGLLASKWLM